jgi:hypothetical protein
VVFDLVRRNPLRYVEVCRSLYETGRVDMGGGSVIEPGGACRASAPKPGITPADWLLLAGMRDAANVLFPVTASSGGIAGISTPDELMGWATRLLGMGHAHYESTLVYGEFAAMRGARRALELNGVAYLLIDSALLTGNRPAVHIPNHWVTFLGGLSIDDGVWWKHDSGRITFDCYSWGAKHHLVKGEGTFEDSLFGVVTAWP